MDAPIIALQGSGSAGVPQADLVTLLRDGKVTSADLLALAFGPLHLALSGCISRLYPLIRRMSSIPRPVSGKVTAT